MTDDVMYNEAIQQLAEGSVMTFMENGGDKDAKRDLHRDLAELQGILEATCDIFGKSMQQVEQDMIDMIEHLPIEELAQSRALADKGRLN